MSSPSLLDDADAVLQSIAAHGVRKLVLSAAPEAIKRLNGKGIVVAKPDEPDIDEDPMTPTNEAHLTSVHVDPKALLTEVLSAYSFTVSDGPSADFLVVKGPAVADRCACFVLLNNNVPPYAIAPLSDADLKVVFHTNPDIAAVDNAVLNGLSVHAIRLRELPKLTKIAMESVRDQVAGVSKAAGAPAGTPAVPANIASKLIENARKAVTDQVETYASTKGADQLFEAATAKILAPLIDRVIVLGGKLTGKPVPDGLLLQAFPQRRLEVASYDCKSKHSGEYNLAAEHGDQQARYVLIQDRLEQHHGWAGRGIVLFTPKVQIPDFDAQVAKDFWRQITDKGYSLLVVQANLLRRWNELTSAELPASWRSHFAPHLFWSALFDQKLQGVADADLNRYYPSRGQLARLLTETDAELAWLAGLTAPQDAVAKVAESLVEADPDHIDAAAVTRPILLQRFFAVLRTKKPKLDELGPHLSLSPIAVRYLLNAKPLHPQGEDEAGQDGFSNLKRLRDEANALP